MGLKGFLNGLSRRGRGDKRKPTKDALPERIKHADRLVDSALNSWFTQNFETALEQLTEARDIYFDERHPSGVIRADMQLALLLEEKFDRASDAIALYREAIEVCRETDSKWDEITVLLELAHCYRRCGEIEKARECYERAHDLAVEIGDAQGLERIMIESQALDASFVIPPQIAHDERTLYELISGHQYLDALEFLVETREFYSKDRDSEGIKWSDSNLSRLIEDQLGQLPRAEAIALFEKAVQVCQRANSKHGEIAVLLALAPCYLMCGEKDKAKRCYERAYEVAQWEIGDQTVVARVLYAQVTTMGQV